MTDVILKNRCGRCAGTGDDSNGRDADGNLVVIPCVTCDSTGYVPGAKIDVTDIMAELSYIHGKVTAIWNKVKKQSVEEIVQEPK